MDKWRKMKIRNYSKGMMQRLGIAQALLAQPDLVILDEPTDGVDPLGRKHIRDILARLRDEGKTIFLNSHLLSEVELICDRVGILNKGRVVRIGTVDELTESSDRYVITLAAPPAGKPELVWRDGCRLVSMEGPTIVIATDHIESVNDIIDQLRRNGVLIQEIARERHSLEEMFINLIAGDNSESAHHS
jgi:ABC-2 type transport system ATP-binding protein